MTLEKKVLLTTAYVDKLYDYWEANNKSRIFRLTWIRRCSFGLRFIKKNLPDIEILEYPKWDEYVKKIKQGNYDIVGFSFYTHEIPEVLRMIEFAKKNGVKEIWGGNYGILNEDIKKYFDKTFIGYAEHDIAKALGTEINVIKHPIMIVQSGLPIGLNFINLGTIFTTRGCSIGCKFCQTPSFCPNVSKVPIESIEEALKEYRKMGVKELLILDENFGLLKDHAEEVISLLNKYGFYWLPMTRADILNQNLKEWSRKGLFGAFIGIEGLSQGTLDYIGKKEKVVDIIELIKNMNKKNLFIVGYYVIGFDNETIESIKADMKKLKSMNLDLYQVCILTPLPNTALWKEIETKYGIFDFDYNHYNTKYLVWNHPNIKPEEMKKLLDWCFQNVYPNGSLFRTLFKLGKKYTFFNGFFGGIWYIIKSIFQSNISYYIRKSYKKI